MIKRIIILSHFFYFIVALSIYDIAYAQFSMDQGNQISFGIGTGYNGIFNSGATVNPPYIPPDAVLYGQTVSCLEQSALQLGLMFEYAPPSFQLDSGETVDIVITTPSDKYEVWYQIRIDSGYAGNYTVYNEPTGVTSESITSPRSLNPHMQFIGAPQSGIIIYESPTFTNPGQLVKGPILWGIPAVVTTARHGGFMSQNWRIFSPNQTLRFVLGSDQDNNRLTGSMIFIVKPGGIKE